MLNINIIANMDKNTVIFASSSNTWYLCWWQIVYWYYFIKNVH